MDIIGVTYDQMVGIVEKVSAQYGGNVELHTDAKPLSSRSFRGRIVTKDADGPGSRRSWSGRRGRWACWHLYRDVMFAALLVNPEARIKSSLADYRGIYDFQLRYPQTANKNIGSMVAPARMPDLCDCH